ncbi:MAG TPA: type II toxin-antitoxin system PemK/MazF family toxin [Rubrobacteraceae bacterium]|nr:type II toxin-antitoxin system PemK/MazF family toxin [Rubrobacteraceae bacterium]
MAEGNGESGERLEIGDVVSALFPLHRPGGREQEGYRPAVVVGLPEFAGTPRFGALIFTPMTTDRGQAWARRSPELYPRYPEGTANLKSPSVCLLDQVRALDVGRVRDYRGTLSTEEYRPIGKGLAKMIRDPR